MRELLYSNVKTEAKEQKRINKNEISFCLALYRNA